jgi:acetylornithine/succinyldiaminopimelate/putrescine aminotransferase/predicted amino acid dehydrogenase
MNVQPALSGAVLLNEEREFLLRQVHMNRPMVKGKGMYLYDAEGTQYVDFLSQYGAVSFGQNPEFVWDAIAAVHANGEPSLVQPLLASAAIKLAERLVELMPFAFRHVTLCNSGAESVEAAFKMARAATKRAQIVSLSCSFHGKTHGAVLATGNANYREPFGIRSDDFIKVAPNDLEGLEAALERGTVAALILEPVVGEGGMRALDAQYMKEARRLCRQYGTLVIADEIQTGLFRCGQWLACASVEGFEPDIVCLAKALGGGVVPIGVVLASHRVWSEEFGLFHSSTFANNQMTCAVGVAVLDYLERESESLSAHVREMAKYLEAGLARLVDKYPDVYVEHSGAGLMQGIKINKVDGHDSYFMAHACGAGTMVALLCGYLFHRHHLILAPLLSQKDLIRIEPPLIVEAHHIDQLLAGLDDCALLLRQKRGSSLLSYLFKRTPEEVSYSERPRAPISIIVEAHGASQVAEKRLGSFAFLIHPPGDDDLIHMMPESIENLNPLHTSEVLEWMRGWFLKRHEPSPVFHAERIPSKAGGYVEGWLIASPLTSRQMLRLSRVDRCRLMDGFVDRACELKADIMGLGAFTSVITRSGTEIDQNRIHITTGNSLTAFALAESALEALRWANGNDPALTVAVVGAAGSVGRLAALSLSETYARLVLVGNPSNPRSIEKLYCIIGEIYAHALIRLQQGVHDGLAGFFRSRLRGIFSVLNRCNQQLFGASTPDYLQIKQLVEEHLNGPSPVRASVQPAEVLPACHGVLSATSHGREFIEASWLRTGAVVADAARPADLQSSVRRERPDVLAYEGGLVRLPEPYRFGRANVLGFHPQMNLGCLSETMVLAMSGVDRSYSIGDRIPYEEAFRVNKLAQLHGFAPCIATGQGEIELKRSELPPAREERA